MKAKYLFLPLCASLTLANVCGLNIQLNAAKTYLQTVTETPLKFISTIEEPLIIECGYDQSIVFAKRTSSTSNNISIQNYDFKDMAAIKLQYAEKQADKTPASNGQFIIPLDSIVPCNKYTSHEATDAEYQAIKNKFAQMGITIAGTSYIKHNKDINLEAGQITSAIIKKFFSPAAVYFSKIHEAEEEIIDTQELTYIQKKVILCTQRKEIVDDFAVTLITEKTNNNNNLVILDTNNSCTEYKINTKMDIKTSFATNNSAPSKTIATFIIQEDTNFSGINCFVEGITNIKTKKNVMFAGENSMFRNLTITAQHNPNGTLTLNGNNTAKNITITDCGFCNNGLLTIQDGGILRYTCE